LCTLVVKKSFNHKVALSKHKVKQRGCYQSLVGGKKTGK